jgi:hypothetical protein
MPDGVAVLVMLFKFLPPTKLMYKLLPLPLLAVVLGLAVVVLVEVLIVGTAPPRITNTVFV